MKHLTKTQNAIGGLILFCIALMLFRAVYTQTIFFGFLLWNMFLAIIPYVISESIKKYQFKKTRIVIGLLLWVLFLPNAPYMITDIVHLHHSKSTMLWYDLFMIFCFANTGLLIAIISINDIYKIIKKQYNTQKAGYFITAIFLVCGFGIYVGRFLRFNSWDFITNPLTVLQKSVTSLTDSTTWCITIGFAFLLQMVFSVFKNFKELKKS